MDAVFLKNKSIGWMEQLMDRTESYCTRRANRDRHYIDASRIPLVRTNRGEQICARNEAGKLQVYLNNPDIASFRIDASFIRNEVIRSFYERALGIPEYNVEQETVENILPKYAARNPRFKSRDPIQENIEDLKIIKDAIYTNPSVLDKIADKFIVTDGRDWYMPCELYIQSGEIRSGYQLVDGIVQIRYLTRHYFEHLKLDEDFFKRIGCNYGIRALQVSREEYLRMARKYAGSQMQKDLCDHIFSKTYISTKFDWSFNFEGFPGVFENITKERSLAIARFLNSNVERFAIQGDLVGADDQHFSGKNVDSMSTYSMLGFQLCFIRWIYINGDLKPHCPGEVDIADILPEYSMFAKRLIAVLPFKEVKNPLTEWLNKNIGNKGDLNLVKKLFSDPEELVKIAKAKAKSEAKDAARNNRKSLRDLLGEGDKEQKKPPKDTDVEFASISERGKEKREKKLDEEFRASLDEKVYIARGLSFSRRNSSKEERLFLEQEYGGTCQICLKKITKYNGDPYFEAINIIRTSTLDEHLIPTEKRGWNSLCLCPNCAAEYNNCSKTISTLYDQVIRAEVEIGSEEPIDIQIELPKGKRRSIHYSPRHMIALKEAFKIFTENQD